jgi:hypothetical protein
MRENIMKILCVVPSGGRIPIVEPEEHIWCLEKKLFFRARRYRFLIVGRGREERIMPVVTVEIIG